MYLCFSFVVFSYLSFFLLPSCLTCTVCYNYIQARPRSVTSYQLCLRILRSAMNENFNHRPLFAVNFNFRVPGKTIHFFWFHNRPRNTDRQRTHVFFGTFATSNGISRFTFRYFTVVFSEDLFNLPLFSDRIFLLIFFTIENWWQIDTWASSV